MEIERRDDERWNLREVMTAGGDRKKRKSRTVDARESPRQCKQESVRDRVGVLETRHARRA